MTANEIAPSTDSPGVRRTGRVYAWLDPDSEARLAFIAARRFAGVKTRALEAGIALVAHVYGDVSTFGALEPIEALQAYIRAHQSDQTDDAEPPP